MLEADLPDPRDEFERLAQLYGPKHHDTPHVAAVFGNFGPGVNALRDAIARAATPLVQMPAEDVPVVADSEPVVETDLDEGGDSDDEFFTDLAGDVTEPAEAVA